MSGIIASNYRLVMEGCIIAFSTQGPGVASYEDYAESPCAPLSPAHPECDLAGARPVGCGGTPVTPTTWGGIKALYGEGPLP